MSVKSRQNQRWMALYPYTGIYWDEVYSKWTVRFWSKKTNDMVYVGRFTSLNEALKTRDHTLQTHGYSLEDIDNRVRQTNIRQPGVDFCETTRSWRVRKTINGERRYFGVFPSYTDAVKTYQKAST